MLLVRDAVPEVAACVPLDVPGFCVELLDPGLASAGVAVGTGLKETGADGLYRSGCVGKGGRAGATGFGAVSPGCSGLGAGRFGSVKPGKRSAMISEAFFCSFRTVNSGACMVSLVAMS